MVAARYCTISLSAYGLHDFDAQRFEGLLLALRGVRSLRLSGTASDHETYEALGELNFSMLVIQVQDIGPWLCCTGELSG